MNKLSKRSVLVVLAVTMGTVSVLMNVFAGLRPFYNEGSAGWLRAISFSTLVVSWFPFLVGNILADRYEKKYAIGIPALAFALQALIYTLAIPAGYKDEGWQNLFAGMIGNYSGLLLNIFTFLALKKILGTDRWWSLALVAGVSTLVGQFGDNLMYMMFSPFQWAGNIFEGGKLIGVATQWQSVNLVGANGEWTGRLAILGWDSLVAKTFTETLVEVLTYPIMIFLIRKIEVMPEYYDLEGLPVYK